MLVPTPNNVFEVVEDIDLMVPSIWVNGLWQHVGDYKIRDESRRITREVWDSGEIAALTAGMQFSVNKIHIKKIYKVIDLVFLNTYFGFYDYSAERPGLPRNRIAFLLDDVNKIKYKQIN